MSDQANLADAVDVAVDVAAWLDGFLAKNIMGPDLSGWDEALPLRVENQLRVLAQPCVDALEAGSRAMSDRLAAIGIAATRFLAETQVMMAWLMQPEDDTRRQRRAFEALHAEMAQQTKLLASIADHETDPTKKVADHQQQIKLGATTAKLLALAESMGFANLGQLPPQERLFNNFHPSGYDIFRMTSNFGRHPALSFAPMIASWTDGVVETFDPTGNELIRAYFVRQMIEESFEIARHLAGAHGWEQALSELAEQERRFASLRERISARWHWQIWGG
ncbi:MAG TPA: hypothetical protein VFI59_02965 [Actinomycetota bacterium]|nr:hypothetical protein [Actinomycetota bacterium]